MGNCSPPGRTDASTCGRRRSRGDDRAGGGGWNGDVDRFDTLIVTGLEPERIADLVAESGLRLHELYRQRASLEDAFIDLTRDAVEYVAEHPGRQGS